MSSLQPERLMDADEVAELLSCDRRTVLRKAKNRQLGCIRDGRFVKFKAKHVADYQAAHEQPAIPAQVPARAKR